jgi:hypothetical protein
MHGLEDRWRQLANVYRKKKKKGLKPLAALAGNAAFVATQEMQTVENSAAILWRSRGHSRR